MPIDLPPPVTPIEVPVAVLEERQAGAQPGDGIIEIKTESFRILISGPTIIPEERIREVLSIGKTAAQQLLLLNSLFLADDYHLVNIEFARDGDTIYAHINRGEVVEVNAPPRYQPYFRKFEGRSELRTKDLQPRIILAGIKSQRTGEDVTLDWSIVEDDPTRYRLTVESTPKPTPWHEAVDIKGVFGNPGNRFLGRYFASASARLLTGNGDAFSLGYTGALIGIGDDTFEGDELDRFDAGYGIVTPFGLYRLSASYTDYTAVSVNGDSVRKLDAEIQRAKLEGTQILFANRDLRWLMNQEIEYVDSRITVERPEEFRGQRLQDEVYPAARLGTQVSTNWKLFERKGDTRIGVGYKRGLTADSGTLDRESESRPPRTARFHFFDATLRSNYALGNDMRLRFFFNGQKALGRQVPQQQQWILGGPDNIAAFLPGVLVGDTGLYSRLSWELPRWQNQYAAFRASFFAEFGSARFENSDDGTRSISDAGIKLEAAVTRHFTAEVQTAMRLSESGLSDETIEDARSTVFFSLKADFGRY